LPCSTVSAALKRCGLGKLGHLGLAPAERYERQRPGELIHVDVKKLGRIEVGAGKRITGGDGHYVGSFTAGDGKRHGTVGWDFVHVAIDDATRLAYAEVLATRPPRPRSDSASHAGVYARHGITVERVGRVGLRRHLPLKPRTHRRP
jgi:hypothetical protein